jgi:hypothetical protein
MENNNNVSINLGFAGALTIAFIVLKLVGVINWSWIWILSPLWIGFILGLVILIIIVVAWALIQ